MRNSISKIAHFWQFSFFRTCHSQSWWFLQDLRLRHLILKRGLVVTIRQCKSGSGEPSQNSKKSFWLSRKRWFLYQFHPLTEIFALIPIWGTVLASSELLRTDLHLALFLNWRCGWYWHIEMGVEEAEILAQPKVHYFCNEWIQLRKR